MKTEIEVIEDQIIYTVGEIELRLEQRDGGINPISFDFDGEEEYWDEHWEEIEEEVLNYLQKAEKTYLLWVNDFITTSHMAMYLRIPEEDLAKLIRDGKQINNRR